MKSKICKILFCRKFAMLFHARGYSMLEMVVVLGIVTLVSTVVLANYPAFNERLGVRRAAEDIASSIRQAQSFGLGVKEFGPGSGIFPGYGISFERYASTGVPATFYTLYADSNNNLAYDTGETISYRTIQGKAVVDDICADQKQATPGPCGINYFFVEYSRPRPSVSLQSDAGFFYNDVEIKIKGSRGTTKTIVIWYSGQVSIE